MLYLSHTKREGLKTKPIYIEDVYGDEASVEVIDQPFHKDHKSPLVMLNVSSDMMLTPKAARELAAALILAAEDCE